ncbi:MAG: MarR family transcriptional regulator [Betaproteobacteria bacterium]|nr:MarR family transcriptional regulator [Betaproteobacteria bacterium]
MQLDRSLTYRLHLLHKVSDHASHQAYSEQLGLSLSETRCLATVGAFQPMSVMDLADRGNLNKGQASRAAQILVDKGLVAKHHNPEDARGVSLSLTTLGKKRWQQTMGLIEARNQQIFGCLSQAECNTLSALLDRLIEHNRIG